MRNKLYLILYYLIGYNLPTSRFSPIFGWVRSFLIAKIVGNRINILIERRVYISDAKHLSIGKNVEINEEVFIQGAKIGDDVLIAPNVSILTTSHIHESIDIPIKFQGDSEPNIPEIGNGVWIGRNVVILPGVVIGEGTIVGAGAVVTKDLDSYSVYGGVPAKFIKVRGRNDCC